MTRAGRDMDYDFATKDNWRKTAWNDIFNRLEEHERNEGVFLYLSGHQNNDLDEIVKRGSPPWNAVAVDNSLRVVKHLRKSGQLAVHGDIFDVARQWPADKVPVAGLFIDLCGTFATVTSQFQRLVCFDPPSLHGFVICANILRGREQDKEIKEYQKSVSEIVSMISIPGRECFRVVRNKYLKDERDLGIHRGLHLFYLTAEVEAYNNTVMSLVKNGMDISSAKKEATRRIPFTDPRPSHYGETLRYASLYYRDIYSKRKPTLLSYMSNSGQVFDSVIWRSPAKENIFPPNNNAMSRQISAVLAHRTMRRKSA